MIEIHLPAAPGLWALPPPDSAKLLEQLATLQLENAALRAQNAVLQVRIRELEAQLGQNSSNSSRPRRRIHPRRRRAPRPRRPAGSDADNQDTGGLPRAGHLSPEELAATCEKLSRWRRGP